MTLSPIAPILLGGVLLACGTAEPRPTTNNDSLIAGPPLPARTVFPPNNDWNRDVSADSVDVDSDSLIAHCGAAAALHPDFGTWYQGALWGIPFATVRSTQPRVPVSFYYASESDPGPYPIPPNVPIEGGSASTGDRHVIVVDVDAWKLYELFDARPGTAAPHGPRARAPCSTWRPARCGRTAGLPPMQRGCRSSRVSCATMRQSRQG